MDRLNNGIDDRNAYIFAADRRGDHARIFRAAERHSRRVRFLRIGIPIGAAVATVLIVAAVWFNPLRALTQLPIDLSNLIISGTKITMEAPRVAGYTRDSRAYELSARAAAQDITKPHLMELRELRAKVEMENKSIVEMSAAAGVYDTKEAMLTLSPNIVLSSSTGYEGYLSEAIVDIRKGNIVSTKPVSVKLLNGTLSANRLEVINAGEAVRFEGGVAMTLDLSKSAVAPTEEQKP